MAKSDEHILGEVAAFADDVVLIVEKMKDVVERFTSDRYEELAESARELDRLESVADDTKEAILDKLALFADGQTARHSNYDPVNEAQTGVSVTAEDVELAFMLEKQRRMQTQEQIS